MPQTSVRKRSFSIWALLSFVVLLLSPVAAHADAGIPMLPFAYPVIIAFLIPVIGIEALYLRLRLRTSWQVTLAATAKANLLTMLLGFPLAWVVYFVLEMLLWLGITYSGVSDHFKWTLGDTVGKMLIAATSAAWIGPMNERFAIPCAL